MVNTYIKVFIIVLFLAYKGYVKYNRLVHFKQQDFAFSQVHSQDVSQPGSLLLRSLLWAPGLQPLGVFTWLRPSLVSLRRCCYTWDPPWCPHFNVNSLFNDAFSKCSDIEVGGWKGYNSAHNTVSVSTPPTSPRSTQTSVMAPCSLPNTHRHTGETSGFSQPETGREHNYRHSKQSTQLRGWVFPA